MPKTDVTEERGLSRLQGIDLREHADQNVAHDCVNLRLDNASRLTNYPRPTKVKAGSFSFACESKNPSLVEFDFSLDGYFGTPTITGQASYDDGKKVRIIGTNLLLVDKVIVIAEDGTCIESGQDFGFDFNADGDLILDFYFSEYSKYDKIILANSYGTIVADVDIVVRTSKTLYIGNRYKMGVNSETNEFCIWQRSGSEWTILASYGSPSATPWIEGAELKDEQTDGICLSFSGEPCWEFFGAGSLSLGYSSQYYGEWGQLVVNSEGIQTWGNASGDFDPYEVVEPTTEYTFGTFETYRLRATANNSLVLEMKSNSETDTYDITLNEWHYEQ